MLFSVLGGGVSGDRKVKSVMGLNGVGKFSKLD